MKIPWEKSIWFFDIDDTLIDTANTSNLASTGIKNFLSKSFPESIAVKIAKGFNNLFDLMVAGYRVKNESDWENVPGGKPGFDNFIKRMEQRQQSIIKKYGAIKKWSREMLISFAAEDIGIKLSPNQAKEAADAYWLELTNRTEILPGVLELFAEITGHNRPIYFITSSDARLQMDKQRNFTYEPKYSESLKRKRIELLKQKGIKFDGLAIGDPEDKPHLDFFLKGIKIAEKNLGNKLDYSNCLMFGDSYSGDLETPKNKLGFGLVVLYIKGLDQTKIEDEHFISTGNIHEVLKFLN